MSYNPTSTMQAQTADARRTEAEARVRELAVKRGHATKTEIKEAAKASEDQADES